MDYYIKDGKLYHHGIPGMKWGVRRYQNKDGSLKPAGRKRYESSESTFAKLKRTMAERKQAQAEAARIKAAAERAEKIKRGKISAKDMTDEELKARIARIELEKTYKQTIKNNRQLGRGSRFIEKFADSTIDKVAENVFADIVSQTLKTFAVKGVNHLIGNEEVFTNNKKKN